MLGIAAKCCFLARRLAVVSAKNFCSVYIHLSATQDEPVAHVSLVCVGKTINCVITQRYRPVRVGI